MSMSSIDLRGDPERREARLAPALAIRRDAHEAVHALLGLEQAVGVATLDVETRGLDARLLTHVVVGDVDLPTLGRAEARVHPVQHLRPVLGVGAAGARLDLQEGVEAVVWTTQHALRLHRPHHGLDPIEKPERLTVGRILAVCGHLRVELDLVERLGLVLEVLDEVDELSPLQIGRAHV